MNLCNGNKITREAFKGSRAGTECVLPMKEKNKTNKQPTDGFQNRKIGLPQTHHSRRMKYGQYKESLDSQTNAKRQNLERQNYSRLGVGLSTELLIRFSDDEIDTIGTFI